MAWLFYRSFFALLLRLFGIQDGAYSLPVFAECKGGDFFAETGRTENTRKRMNLMWMVLADLSALILTIDAFAVLQYNPPFFSCTVYNASSPLSHPLAVLN